MSSGSLKILMLHGFTQNGPLFNAKTKVLQKALIKVFPGTTFVYPTGPTRLTASQIPGANPSPFQADDDDSQHYAWWRRADDSDPPEYLGIEKALGEIAQILKEQGPFDGVMGFSQGGAAASIVTSLLEPGRKLAFERTSKHSTLSMRYPASFAALDHPPLKFCVSYSGFPAAGERYQAVYNPVIATPMCHVLGTLDSVVEEDRTHALIRAAGGIDKTVVIMHPGGHFVPNAKQYVEAVASFIKDTLEGKKAGDQQEENVEDMDVPF